MTGQAIFEMLPSEVIFAIPVAVIATLAILLVRRIAIKRAAQGRDSVARTYSATILGEDVGTIDRRIDAAKAADNKAVLADLYLAQARAYQKLGDEKPAWRR